jgi:hypothetical protein
LKIKAASSGQPDIEQQAGGRVRPAGLEELIYRSEQLRLQPDGSEQAADRLPDCGIIIDDDYGRYRVGYRQRSRGGDGRDVAVAEASFLRRAGQSVVECGPEDSDSAAPERSYEVVSGAATYSLM